MFININPKIIGVDHKCVRNSVIFSVHQGISSEFHETMYRTVKKCSKGYHQNCMNVQNCQKCSKARCNNISHIFNLLQY